VVPTVDTAILVALIGVVGTLAVAVLNHVLQRRLVDQGDRIDELYLLSMSEDAFGQLRKLASGHFGSYWVDPDMRYGLGPELNHLKILGFIRFDRDPAVPDIRELPKGNQPELSQFISVTDHGHEFIRRRQETELRRARRERRSNPGATR
jgi:hypothetical protein